MQLGWQERPRGGGGAIREPSHQHGGATTPAGAGLRGPACGETSPATWGGSAPPQWPSLHPHCGLRPSRSSVTLLTEAGAATHAECTPRGLTQVPPGQARGPVKSFSQRDQAAALSLVAGFPLWLLTESTRGTHWTSALPEPPLCAALLGRLVTNALLVARRASLLSLEASVHTPDGWLRGWAPRECSH